PARRVKLQADDAWQLRFSGHKLSTEKAGQRLREWTHAHTFRRAFFLGLWVLGAFIALEGFLARQSTASEEASLLPRMPAPQSVERVTIGLHEVVEQIVRHLRAAHLALVDIEAEMNAAPDAAVRFVVAELPEAGVGLRPDHRVGGRVPRGRERLTV